MVSSKYRAKRESAYQFLHRCLTRLVNVLHELEYIMRISINDSYTDIVVISMLEFLRKY